MNLVSWLKANKVRMAGPPIGLSYDNPPETPAERPRSEACVPISVSGRSGGKVKVKDLPGGQVAVTRHKGQPERYKDTYGSFLEGLIKEGYTLAGPTWEVFDEPREDLRPGKGTAIKPPIGKT